jgi:copper chaperone
MSTTTTSYSVTGMTCSHCVAAVTEEVSRLDGVSAVDVDLNPGGDSRVTVTSTVPLPVDAVREAVDEAGYTLAS